MISIIDAEREVEYSYRIFFVIILKICYVRGRNLLTIRDRTYISIISVTTGTTLVVNSQFHDEMQSPMF